MATLTLGARGGAWQVILPVAFQCISDLMAGDWRAKFAALVTMAAVGEGSAKRMRAHLDGVVDAAVPCLAHEHPRVRYGACHVVGHLSVDFGPEHDDITGRLHAQGFASAYHARVVMPLLRVLVDARCPRVQAHASAAVRGVVDNLTEDIDALVLYLDDLVGAVLANLSLPSIKLREDALETLAVIAQSTESSGRFQTYYGATMPGLMTIIRDCTGPALYELRSKALYCMARVAMAAGKDLVSYLCVCG